MGVGKIMDLSVCLGPVEAKVFASQVWGSHLLKLEAFSYVFLRKIVSLRQTVVELQQFVLNLIFVLKKKNLNLHSSDDVNPLWLSKHSAIDTNGKVWCGVKNYMYSNSCSSKVMWNIQKKSNTSKIKSLHYILQFKWCL